MHGFLWYPIIVSISLTSTLRTPGPSSAAQLTKQNKKLRKGNASQPYSVPAQCPRLIDSAPDAAVCFPLLACTCPQGVHGRLQTPCQWHVLADSAPNLFAMETEKLQRRSGHTPPALRRSLESILYQSHRAFCRQLYTPPTCKDHMAIHARILRLRR